MDKAVIILAGGTGSRLNLGYNKMLYNIEDKPLYEIVLNKFKDFKIYFVSNDITPSGVVQVKAGKTRFESVYNALQLVKEEYVLIHDGARPFVSEEIIKNSLNHELFYVGVKSKDTIRINNNTPNRDDCIIVQTPQGGLTKYFLEAYNRAYNNGREYTDDISVVLDYFDIKPDLVIGSYDNIKITSSDDLLALNNRIGYSWDVHKLVSNRPLILGGITIPFDKGLLGHSDGDALLHAIAEAILGALALGDLGKIFPDNDPSTEGISSTVILKKVLELMNDKGYRIVNIDSLIYAEKPKMAPFIDCIRKNISTLCNIGINNISVKATTYESLGKIGSGLAIASSAIVLLKRI